MTDSDSHLNPTVVLGASPKPDRISHQAVADLKAYGHDVIPVHPLAEDIQGFPVRASLSTFPKG